MSNNKSKLIIADLKQGMQLADKLSKSWGIDKNPHPDLLVIDTDKASIGIDEIKQAIEFSSIKPFVAERKVIVIAGAHKLTIQAQNALLKSLEEPHAGSQWLLLAPNESKLLPTVLSRCQKEYLRSSQPIIAQDMSAFLDADLIERLQLIDAIDKNKVSSHKAEQAIQLLEGIADMLRQDLTANRDKFALIAATAEKISKTGYSKLLLENVAINL